MATALTPIAFFETVMVKSYETLVDSNTKVDVNTGIVAAGRLQSLIVTLASTLGALGEDTMTTTTTADAHARSGGHRDRGAEGFSR